MTYTRVQSKQNNIAHAHKTNSKNLNLLFIYIKIYTLGSTYSY